MSKLSLPVFLSSFFLLFSVVSCASVQANLFLIQKTSDQDKAEILFKEGVARYNEDLLKNDDLKAIPTIRTYFSSALAFDPTLAKARQYLADLDSFKDKRFASYIKKAKSLFAQSGRAEAQDYEMVLYIKKAGDLKTFDADLIKLNADTHDIRSKVIQKRETVIDALMPQIRTEKNQQALIKLLREQDRIVRELQNIDPSNNKASASKKETDALIADLVKKDVDTARALLAAKKYPEASVPALRAEKNVLALTTESNPEIRSLKYDIYYAWANSLFSAKKYQQALDKVAIALYANRTQAAVALKSKINQSASIRDYDAEISDILDSVDSLIATGDLSGAQNDIQTILPKLKKQENRDSLSARTAQVQAQVKQLYQDGIALYNQEDYSGAKTKFAIVVDVNADYEQAQAYLDRTNTKIRALSGMTNQ